MDRDKSLILAKIESTYGTDPVPAAATEALVTVGEPGFSVLGNPRQRNVPLSYFGQLAPINVGEGLSLSFKTELKGSGAAGTVSRYGPLFRACNFTETISAGVSFAYAMNSTLEGESITLYFYANGTLHKMMGCVGKVKLNFKTLEINTAEWEFTGLYASPHASDVTFPTPTHETIAPLLWKNANFVYNSVATLVIDELTLDIGNTISKRVDANNATGISRYYINQREVKGTMNPEKVALTTLNPWTIYDASTSANLETKPTGTAGNLVEVVATSLILEPPKYGNRENVLNWDLSFSVNPTLSAGNNEVSVTFK